MEKTQLLGLFPEELAEELAEYKLPAFRLKQLFSWLHRGAAFDQMSNLPKALREQLAERYVDQPVTILEKRVSALDGTVKMLYALPDGNCIEGVLMHYHHGYTLCVSTQVGCRMGCVFCASTLNGCVRNLTAAELLGQVHAANTLIDDGHVGNIVLMGSGEPLDNYDQVWRFAQEGLPVTLSLSLHAPNDHIRRQLMPVANAYKMEDVLDACRYYIEKTGRRVIFEYALNEINSSPEHAAELAGRLRGMQCHVNVIPLNAVEEKALRGADEAAIQRFMQELEKRHISVTRRREMGDDIDGACGQLRRHYLEEQ